MSLRIGNAAPEQLLSIATSLKLIIKHFQTLAGIRNVIQCLVGHIAECNVIPRAAGC